MAGSPPDGERSRSMARRPAHVNDDWRRRIMAVPIRQIAEVAIVVTDLDRSVRYYNEVLGLPIWERGERNATVRLANGFLGLWLPGVWALPPSPNAAPIRLGRRA